MSVYKWAINITKHTDSTRHPVYFSAEFHDPLLNGMLGTGFNVGEAIRDLKQVRREFVHWYEKDYSREDWERLTTNGRSK